MFGELHKIENQPLADSEKTVAVTENRALIQAQIVSQIQSQNRNDAIAVIHAYNPPFLQRFVVLSTGDGIYIVDGTKPATPAVIAAFAGAKGGGAVALEAFPLDRMVDEDGVALKDVSHEGARYLKKAEFDRLLRVPLK